MPTCAGYVLACMCVYFLHTRMFVCEYIYSIYQFRLLCVIQACVRGEVWACSTLVGLLSFVFMALPVCGTAVGVAIGSLCHVYALHLLSPMGVYT